MVHASRSIIVSDTSVLVNFLRIDRMDLIARHSHDFMVTDHVREEITDYYPDQQVRFAAATTANAVEQVSVTHPEQLRLFASLCATGRLGAGECSAIALAAHQGHILAIDDRRAANEAGRVCQRMLILRTQDVVVSMIREGLLDIQEADAIKNLWAAKHRFRLKVESFGDLLSN